MKRAEDKQPCGPKRTAEQDKALQSFISAHEEVYGSPAEAVMQSGKDREAELSDENN